jgi:hypothetical protein
LPGDPLSYFSALNIDNENDSPPARFKADGSRDANNHDSPSIVLEASHLEYREKGAGMIYRDCKNQI